ncbi:hypothetical protein DDB_G0274611 [Dictyostelium discoideum AX4]|uniref:Uncharacterized protein n=1 Tax=Dictyostelium discoideum TaxID=44689 RepID=Q554L1_DICDI|nr:hypothetical protein DDB_G0274611 [Dictyostelium discoideum AX4]EAL70198.1 hypothetical protein DDB_G0274611 [Dictyostelium discoideum AX4]|eukprot:XP_644312.1 hypothetical protein DDB_G0274611 [Dictyostelium discoideum AX4]
MTSTSTPRLYTEEIMFSNCDPLSINNVKELFKKPYLESIDIPLFTIFYFACGWLSFNSLNDIGPVELIIKNTITSLYFTKETFTCLKKKIII